MRDWILIYHRVCPRTAVTAAWFVRGTAVTPDVFEAQIAWVSARFDVVPLHDLIFGTPSSGRPRVALTFDDGYAEVLRTAAPICSRFGVTGTCFVPAGPALRGEALWFDEWYQAMPTDGSSPASTRIITSWGMEPPVSPEEWVMGSARQALARMRACERADRLRELRDLRSDAGPPLYASLEELTDLLALGWGIGGHGGRHVRLPECEEGELGAETAASIELLDRLGIDGPRSFAYPDGAWDRRVAERVAGAGFAIACTTERASWLSDGDPLAVPRLFCRGEGPIPHRLLAGDLGGTS